MVINQRKNFWGFKGVKKGVTGLVFDAKARVLNEEQGGKKRVRLIPDGRENQVSLLFDVVNGRDAAALQEATVSLATPNIQTFSDEEINFVVESRVPGVSTEYNSEIRSYRARK